MQLSQQAATVRDHLYAYPHLTALQATGVFRIRSLSSRISELRRAGYEVIKVRKLDATGQVYVRYSFSLRQRVASGPVNAPSAPVKSFTLEQMMALYRNYCESRLELPTVECDEEELSFGLFVEENA